MDKQAICYTADGLNMLGGKRTNRTITPYLNITKLLIMESTKNTASKPRDFLKILKQDRPMKVSE